MKRFGEKSENVACLLRPVCNKEKDKYRETT